jgi:hypothetical protein
MPTTPCCKAMCWRPNATGLSSLAERHVGRSGIHYETCAAGVSQIKFNQVEITRRPNIPAKTPTNARRAPRAVAATAGK